MEIYKYQSINDYFWKNFINDQLWFSTPLNFDDDFDSNLPLITHYSEKEIEILLRVSYELNFKTQNGFSDSVNIKAFVENKKLQHDFFSSLMTDHIKNRIGITCFSENNMNNILWGNYADKSHGICLGFETENDKTFFKNLYKVDYVSKLPTIKLNITESTEDFYSNFKTFFTTKKIAWKEQQEVRLFRHSPSIDTYTPLALVKIIFGTKTLTNHKNKIISIALQKNKNVEFYDTVVDSGEYKLKKI